MKSRLPQGFGGGGGSNMNDMIKQAQKMQENMEIAKQQLEENEFSVTVGGGAVEVVASGKKEIKQLNIKPDVVDPDDVEMLQDLIISAVNEVIRKIEDASSTEMDKVTGGLSIPGIL